jgi:hypothetical protein
MFRSHCPSLSRVVLPVVAGEFSLLFLVQSQAIFCFYTSCGVRLVDKTGPGACDLNNNTTQTKPGVEAVEHSPVAAMYRRTDVA